MFESSSGYYPNNPHTLEKDLKEFLGENPRLGIKPDLVVAPEEGLSDCGEVYGRLYSALDLSKFNNAVIIGNAPINTGPEISFVEESFKTPLGTVEVDKNFTTQLKLAENFEKRDDLFHIPFVEMQTIFLQMKLDDFKIVPIMINNSAEDDKWEDAVKTIEDILNPQDLLITCSNLATSDKDQKMIKKYDSNILRCLRDDINREKFRKRGQNYNLSGWRAVSTGLEILGDGKTFHLFGHKVRTPDKILKTKTTGFAGICFD